MANARAGARSFGKSDPIDALAVARAALREPNLPTARLDGPERELRLLVDHREDLVQERTRIISRLRWHLHELDPDLEQAARTLTSRRTLDKLAASLTEIDGVVARLAREIIERCRQLGDEIKQLEHEITTLVETLSPSLLQICGCGPPQRRQDPRRDRRHHPFPLPRRLRPPQRHRTPARLVLQPIPSPTQPHRKPPTKRRPPPHRSHPSPPPPTRTSPYRQTPRERRRRPRSTPHPQTPPFRRRLPRTQSRRRHRTTPRRMTPT